MKPVSYTIGQGPLKVPFNEFVQGIYCGLPTIYTATL